MSVRQVVLDTETTGLSAAKGHRVIEIGCLEMIDRRLTGEQFHVYINPERDIDFGAQKVHGLSRKFLSDKPVFSDIFEDFLAFIVDAELIIHNAPFDVGFLNNEFNLVKPGHRSVDEMCSVLDTLVLARRMHPAQKNSLDALCRRYHVDNSNRDLHGALLDTELLAQVYLLMTGGQSQLFQSDSSEASSPSKGREADQRVSGDREALPVISASEEELSAHLKFVDELLSKES
jgi:DNA polymerase III subunit epsilon